MVRKLVNGLIYMRIMTESINFHLKYIKVGVKLSTKVYITMELKMENGIFILE